MLTKLGGVSLLITDPLPTSFTTLWHITGGGRWTFSQNVSFLFFTVWEWRCSEDIPTKDVSLTQVILKYTYVSAIIQRYQKVPNVFQKVTVYREGAGGGGGWWSCVLPHIISISLPPSGTRSRTTSGQDSRGRYWARNEDKWRNFLEGLWEGGQTRGRKSCWDTGQGPSPATRDTGQGSSPTTQDLASYTGKDRNKCWEVFGAVIGVNCHPPTPSRCLFSAKKNEMLIILDILLYIGMCTIL